MALAWYRLVGLQEWISSMCCLAWLTATATCFGTVGDPSWHFACIFEGFRLWWIDFISSVYTQALTFGCWQIDPFPTALFIQNLHLHHDSKG